MKKILTILMCFCVLTVAAPAFADVEKPATTPAAESAHAMDPAMMQKMQEASTPGENHKMLETLVGKWTYTNKMWMTPESPVEESKGTNENTMLYGGRFLQQKVSSMMKMGDQEVPYEGVALTGYDNVGKHFTTTWYDSMNTGIMMSKGTYDAATKTLTETGEANCPIKGGPIKTRSEMKFIDADNYSYTMYMLDDAGKEFKSMEMLYTKQK